MNTRRIAFISVVLVLAILAYGCARKEPTPPAASIQPAAEQAQTASVYTGKIIGRSNKARTISIEVGKGVEAKTMMVRFDDATTGVEHAAKGEAAIITWEMREGDRYATVIKPKLAKLPPGVAEIKPAELKSLIDSGTNLVLIDSRPEKPYSQSHLPGAVSIPVDQMKTAMATLPSDKNTLLVFYCGGFT